MATAQTLYNKVKSLFNVNYVILTLKFKLDAWTVACLCVQNAKIKTEKQHRVIVEVGALKGLKVELNVIHEYKTNIDAVGFLTTSSDDCLWIATTTIKTGFLLFGSNTPLQKVKLIRSKVKVISGFTIKAYSLAITPSNDLLVCTGG